MSKITIIGAGELGQALGKILPSGLHKIVYWDSDESKLVNLNERNLSLAEALLGAEYVFLCIPSWHVKEFLAFASRYWPSKTTFVLMSKGIDGSTGKLPFELADKLLPTGVTWVVASGAMVAEEIKTGHFGACLVASKSSSADARVAELFKGTNILAITSKDIKGVAWSGVLKNIYALGLGIAEGIGWTLNERGLLFAQSLEEILRLMKILGGKKETFLLSPTLADFVTTSFDNNSSNHQAGFELGRDGETDKKSEGLVSLAPLLDLLNNLSTSKIEKIEAFPILQNLTKIVIAHEDPKKVFGKY
jgi:glycerol-3-phosphate dehydrogenase (NAD(P)+)